jgi:hypothetical protein
VLVVAGLGFDAVERGATLAHWLDGHLLFYAAALGLHAVMVPDPPLDDDPRGA